MKSKLLQTNPSGSFMALLLFSVFSWLWIKSSWYWCCYPQHLCSWAASPLFWQSGAFRMEVYEALPLFPACFQPQVSREGEGCLCQLGRSCLGWEQSHLCVTQHTPCTVKPHIFFYCDLSWDDRGAGGLSGWLCDSTWPPVCPLAPEPLSWPGPVQRPHQQLPTWHFQNTYFTWERDENMGDVLVKEAFFCWKLSPLWSGSHWTFRSLPLTGSDLLARPFRSHFRRNHKLSWHREHLCSSYLHPSPTVLPLDPEIHGAKLIKIFEEFTSHFCCTCGPV